MKGINAYQTFGMSVSWLQEYLQDPARWWRQNSLGPRQFEAMKVWLGHAGIVDRSTKELTPFGAQIRTLGTENVVTWGAIWAKLARNSVLVGWYVSSVPFGKSYAKEDLLALMGEDANPRTMSNALSSLVKLLEDTLLGSGLGLGIVSRNGRSLDQLQKRGGDDIPQPLLLYSVYEYAEHQDKFALTVSELVETTSGGPVQLFGVSRDCLLSSLRGLASQYPRLVRTEFVRGLENVYLDASLSSDVVLGELVKSVC